jgi:hypothetical protein
MTAGELPTATKHQLRMKLVLETGPDLTAVRNQEDYWRRERNGTLID